MMSARATVAIVAICLGGVAFAQEGEAPPASQAPASPEAPALSAEGRDVLVSFQAVEGATSVRVERANPDGAFTALGEVAPSAAEPDSGLSYRDPDREPGSTLRYRLVALNAAGASEPSEEVEIRLVRAPGEVRVEPDADEPGALRIFWIDTDSAVRKWAIERRTVHEARGPWEVTDPPRAGSARVVGTKKRKKKKKKKEEGEDRPPRWIPGQPKPEGPQKPTGPELSYRDRSVDANVLYEYRVVALGSDSVAPSAIAHSAPSQAPKPPEDLLSGAFSVDQIVLRWTRGSDDVEGYRVERRAPGSKAWKTHGEPLPPWQTSYADGVGPGDAFEYRVLAVNALGEASSEPAGARTPTRGPSAQGLTGPSRIHRGPTAVPYTGDARPKVLQEHFSPLPDRWRITFPEWNRYPEGLADPEESPYEEGSGLNPYTQNVIKGDYPILGNDIFVVLEGQIDTLVEGRAFPFPSGVSTRSKRSEDFFGDFDQFLYNQNFVLSAEVFQGNTAFRPKDASFKVTAVGNINYLKAFEDNLVNIDVREGDDRLDGHIGLQELLIDKHIVDLGPNYDFVALIAGIQRFQSDFRGFMFADNNLGVRLQTNYLSNRLQLNLAWFHQLEKDTNSGLNLYEFRNQNVFVANLYIQDAFKEIGNALLGHDVLGYTLLFNYHYNWDNGGRHYDTNDFLLRPAKIGQAGGAVGGVRDKDVNVHYVGFGGEGHIGPINLSHQYYLAVGETTVNEISGKKQNVLAHFFAIEASIDLDWLRFKASYLYASGDPNPSNNTASGFSAIFDNPFFAGSGFSYFNRQNIPLVQTGVQLTNRLSLLPDLRSSKLEGASNFVNPGLHLINFGLSARVTPKLFVDANVNFLFFDTTESLQYVLVQDNIDSQIGVDYSLGIQYRPFLTDNVIVTAGGSALVPGSGFRQIYTGQTLYSGFLALTLTY
ncbi:MAG: hypothetical protein JKY65_28035 [Planctomycetes bacterium]|nr:hypothetical protein [Planctomycetota bacterium]